MGFWRGTGKVLGTLVDVRADKWVSYDYLKQSFSRTGRLVGDIFKIEKSSIKESFEEAVIRLGLTEGSLLAREKEFYRLSIAFVMIAVCIFLYGVYLASRQAFFPCVVTFLFTLYALSQAFRFHFWHFQVKNRTLGCTFKEWLNGTPKTPTLPGNEEPE